MHSGRPLAVLAKRREGTLGAPPPLPLRTCTGMYSSGLPSKGPTRYPWYDLATPPPPPSPVVLPGAAATFATTVPSLPVEQTEKRGRESVLIVQTEASLPEGPLLPSAYSRGASTCTDGGGTNSLRGNSRATCTMGRGGNDDHGRQKDA